MNRTEIVSCTEQALQVAHRTEQMVARARSLESQQRSAVRSPKRKVGGDTVRPSSAPIVASVLVLAKVSNLRSKFDDLASKCDDIQPSNRSTQELAELSNAMKKVSRAASNLETELGLDQSLFDFILKIESARGEDVEGQLIVQVIFLFAGDHVRRMKDKGMRLSVEILGELTNSKSGKGNGVKRVSGTKGKAKRGNGKLQKKAA